MAQRKKGKSKCGMKSVSKITLKEDFSFDWICNITTLQLNRFLSLLSVFIFLFPSIPLSLPSLLLLLLLVKAKLKVIYKECLKYLNFVHYLILKTAPKGNVKCHLCLLLL